MNTSANFSAGLSMLATNNRKPFRGMLIFLVILVYAIEQEIVPLAWISGAIGVAMGIDWMASIFLEYAERLIDVDTKTQASRLASEIARMKTKEQVSAYITAIESGYVTVIPPSEMNFVIIDGVPVDREWVVDFIGRADGFDLPSKRDYKKSEWAVYDHVIEALEKRKLIKPAGGPLPPKISTSWHAVMKILDPQGE